MNDRLRDLGRDIANKMSPYRFWFEGQINIIHTQPKEGMQVRGIMAATTSYFSMHSAKCLSHYPPPFEECVKVMGSSNPKDDFSLKYLVFKFKNKHFNPKIGELSRGLVWLRCFSFNHANLSSCFSLESLRVLELYDVQRLKTIWENDANAPLQLRELVIHSPRLGLKYFQGFSPSIGRLQFLNKIAIYGGGSSMTSLPNEFCNLNSLEYLELRSFRELSSLSLCFGNLRNLRHLDLSYCSRINTLPDSFKHLSNLRYLNLIGCRQLTFNSENSSILRNIRKLEFVQLSDCKLEILPRHIANQPYMTKLKFLNSQVKNLPANIGQLRKLEELSMGSPFLTGLPDSLGNLFSLKKLFIIDCPNLKSLPDIVGRLNALEELDIEHTGVESLPETFGQLANLRELLIDDCPIRELAFGPGSKTSLNKLKKIKLDGTRLSTISISEECCPSLEYLELRSCRELSPLPTSFENLRNLRHLDLSGSSMTSLPNEFCNIISLEYLELRSCRELSSLPISFGNLGNLKHLNLSECFRINTLPVSFKQLTNLRYLNLSDCRELTFNSENSSILQNITKLEYVQISHCKLESPFLTRLPDSLGNLLSLMKLEIYCCENLMSLPDSFGNLSSLRKLTIFDCPNLISLPATVGRLNALEELDIKGSGVESLPESFGQLANLRILRIIDCPIRGELAFGSGSKASLNNLRKIKLVGTHLSTVSISEECCPSLETFKLCHNKFLTRIETLPKTVKKLKIRI